MNLNKITLKNIVNFIDGNYEYYKDKIIDRPLHLKEQTYWRLYSCKNTCLLTGECQVCSCPVVKRAFAVASCNHNLFPDLMPGLEWEEYKKENEINNIKEIIKYIDNELQQRRI